MSMFLMDAMMVGLLIMAIAFCWRLNGRLQNMRDMGQEIKPFLKGLGSYITQIAHYIEKLQHTSEAAHKNLGNQLPQAMKIKDDFDFMLDHGEQLADRLEKILENAHAAERQLNEIMQRTHRSRPENFSQTLQEKNMDVNNKNQSLSKEVFTPSVKNPNPPDLMPSVQQHAYYASPSMKEDQKYMPSHSLPSPSHLNEKSITSLLRGLR